jgi:hypothetical protein
VGCAVIITIPSKVHWRKGAPRLEYVDPCGALGIPDKLVKNHSIGCIRKQQHADRQIRISDWFATGNQDDDGNCESSIVLSGRV